jgi:hypothetical protein
VETQAILASGCHSDSGHCHPLATYLLRGGFRRFEITPYPVPPTAFTTWNDVTGVVRSRRFAMGEVFAPRSLLAKCRSADTLKVSIGCGLSWCALPQDASGQCVAWTGFPVWFCEHPLYLRLASVGRVPGCGLSFASPAIPPARSRWLPKRCFCALRFPALQRFPYSAFPQQPATRRGRARPGEPADIATRALARGCFLFRIKDNRASHRHGEEPLCCGARKTERGGSVTLLQ